MYENDCYYLTKDTKQFLLILINHYVEIFLIQVYSEIYHHSTYTQIVIEKILLFSSSVRKSGKNVKFGDKKIKKSDFHKNKKRAKIDDIDVNKILVSKEEPYGTKNSFKYFIKYNDNGLIISLSLYPIKYLNELFVPYGSSLETNILLALMSSILVTLLF